MKESKPLFPVPIEVVVVALVAMAAPVVGGHVTTSPSPIQGSLLAEVLGGPALPLTTRMILALPLVLVFGLVMYRRRVVQLPALPIVGGWLIACGLLFFSGAISPFAQFATAQWWTWPCYVLAMVTVVAVCGRKDGLVWTLSGLATGVTIVAAKGVLEYAGRASTDATWRIMAGWNNPNAVASVLVMGLPVLWALGSRGPRWTTALAGIGGAISLAALWYTGSKGGLLAMLLALAVFAIGALVSKNGVRAAVTVAATVVLAGLLVVGLRPPLKAAAQEKGAPAVRVLSGQQAEQSMEVRKNLWKTALILVRTHPTGLGTGNFRQYSGQPGLVDQTVFAHETWLQLATDGSALCLLAALAAMVAWTVPMLRRDGAMPPSARILKAGVLAAVVGGAAHGLIESNLFFVGAGLVFFVLLGCGCQLAATGSLPLPVGTGTKAVAGVVSLGVLLGLVSSALPEMAKANAIDGLKSGQPEQIVAASEALASSASDDAEALYLRSMYAAKSPTERLSLLKESAERAPTTKTLRALANTQAQAGNVEEAEATFGRALQLDPNNLRTLAGKMRMEKETGHLDAALSTARKLVEVEKTTGFQYRAIPESVPTETYDARVLLAANEPDAKKKVELLKPAVEGYLRFNAVTYPRVKLFAKEGGSFIDMDLNEANRIVTQARAAAEELKAAGQSVGDAAAVEISTRALSELVVE